MTRGLTSTSPPPLMTLALQPARSDFQLRQVFKYVTSVHFHRHLLYQVTIKTRADQETTRLVQFDTVAARAIARNLLNRQFGIEALRIHKRLASSSSACYRYSPEIFGYEFFELSSFFFCSTGSLHSFTRARYHHRHCEPCQPGSARAGSRPGVVPSR